LRPENALALHYARMSSGHRDLLSMYLPYCTSVNVSACPSREVRRKRTSKLTLIGSSSMAVDAEDQRHRIKGIALVDHNVPRSMWDKAEIVAIIGAACSRAP
jgi:exopolyphosphatase